VQTGFSTPIGALSDKQDWDETTWRVGANWHPSDNSLIFGSISTGYKPGGFGSFNIEGPSCEGVPWGLCVADPTVDRPGDFGPETVTSYELGYKGTLMEGRTQLSLTAFFYEYEDMQAIFSEGLRVIVDNVGKVDGTGLEAEVITKLGDNFDFRFGGSYLDTEATEIQVFCANGEIATRADIDVPDSGDINVCEGNSIPWAPEFTAFAILNANFPVGNGEVFGTLAWSWEDDYRGDWPDESVVYQKIEALNQTDIIVGYSTDSWRISAYVENVFDDIWYDGNYADDLEPLAIYSQHAFGPSRPRTAGVRFGVSF
jgi:iron complex outermembrane receptor protein